MTETPIFTTRRRQMILRVGLCSLGFLALALFGLLVVTGIRAHNREVELQIEVSKLKARRHLTPEVDYQSVEVNGCEYLIFDFGVVHAATCANPIHLGNK